MAWFSNIKIPVPRAMSSLLKPAPKKFQYSSQINKRILEQRMGDVADLANKTVSLVIEEGLIDSYLPHDEYASDYVNGVLFGEKCDFDGNWSHYGTRSALSDIFGTVSAGVHWKPARTNARPLVTFASKLIDEHKPTLRKDDLKGIPSDLDELEYAFDSLCSVLADRAKRDGTPGLDAEASLARNEILPAIPKGKTTPAKIMDLILRNWTAIEDSTHTFRTLQWLLAASTDWEDTALDRSEFQQVCESVMSEWTREDEEERKRKKQAEEELPLVNYQIADNAYVRAPRGWPPLNPEIAHESRYAGVVEIRFGERYDAPHFLFFLKDHPVKDMTSEEQDEIKRLAQIRWSGMKEVMADEVALERASDGGIANMEDYSASPRIGMFSIFERGEYPLERQPFGVEIVREDEGAGKEASDV